jgi:hypothetical protein
MMTLRNTAEGGNLQVTDLRCDRQAASAAVSPAVSRVSGAVVSGRTLQCDRFDCAGPKGPHYSEMKAHQEPE